MPQSASADGSDSFTRGGSVRDAQDTNFRLAISAAPKSVKRVTGARLVRMRGHGSDGETLRPKPSHGLRSCPPAERPGLTVSCWPNVSGLRFAGEHDRTDPLRRKGPGARVGENASNSQAIDRAGGRPQRNPTAAPRDESRSIARVDVSQRRSDTRLGRG